MKVYGVYTGCIYEGGGVNSPLYLNEKDAIKDAIKLFDKKKRFDKWGLNHSKKEYKDDPKILAYDEQYYKKFKWRKSRKEPNYWHNTVDCIMVLEYEVV